MSDTRDEYLTPSQVQRVLNLGRSKTYSLLGTEIPVTRIGVRSIRVRRSALEAYLERHTEQPISPQE